MRKRGMDPVFDSPKQCCDIPMLEFYGGGYVPFFRTVFLLGSQVLVNVGAREFGDTFGLCLELLESGYHKQAPTLELNI